MKDKVKKTVKPASPEKPEMSLEEALKRIVRVKPQPKLKQEKKQSKKSK